MFTDNNFLTDTEFKLGWSGVHLPPNIEQPWNKAIDIKYLLRPLEIFFCNNKEFGHILVSIYELQTLIKNPLDWFIIYQFIPIPILTDFWDF